MSRILVVVIAVETTLLAFLLTGYSRLKEDLRQVDRLWNATNAEGVAARPPATGATGGASIADALGGGPPGPQMMPFETQPYTGREEVAASPVAGDEALVVLHGNLLAQESGESIQGWVELLTEGGESGGRVQCDREAGYALPGIASGIYTLAAGSTGRVTTQNAIAIEPHPNPRHLDIRLAPQRQVVVRAVTPEGKPLLQALRERGLYDDLGAIVTRIFPDVPQVSRDFDLQQRTDGGAFRGTLRFAPGRAASQEPGVIGTLEVEGEAPHYVSLVAHPRILETKGLAGAATEVVFTADPDSIVGFLGTVRLKVVGAAGEPLKSFWLHFNGRGYMVERMPRDEEGRLVLKNIHPGPIPLILGAEGSAWIEQEVILASGEDKDLGTIELRPAARVHGRVLDKKGSAVGGAEVAFADLETTSARTMRSSWGSRVAADAQGVFTLENLRGGRYRLSVTAPGFAAAHRVVEAREGESREIPISLEAGQEVVIEPENVLDLKTRIERSRMRWRDHEEDLELSVMDETGVELWHKVRPRNESLHLAPGTYTLRIRGPGTRSHDLRFDVPPGNQTIVRYPP